MNVFVVTYHMQLGPSQECTSQRGGHEEGAVQENLLQPTSEAKTVNHSKVCVNTFLHEWISCTIEPAI